MKTFKFSLQCLLDAKSAKERAAEVQFAKSIRELQVEKMTLVRLQARRDRIVSRTEEVMGMSAGREELCLHSLYLASVDQHLVAQKQRIRACERAVDEARGALLALAKEREILENLRKREDLAWSLDRRRAEDKAMDEIASAGFLRNRLA